MHLYGSTGRPDLPCKGGRWEHHNENRALRLPSFSAASRGAEAKKRRLATVPTAAPGANSLFPGKNPAHHSSGRELHQRGSPREQGFFPPASAGFRESLFVPSTLLSDELRDVDIHDNRQNGLCDQVKGLLGADLPALSRLSQGKFIIFSTGASFVSRNAALSYF